LFFEFVLSSLESDMHKQQCIVAVIEDDVRNDLGDGAIDLGFWRVLGTRIPCFVSHNNDQD
jgi:hypothetical protein